MTRPPVATGLAWKRVRVPTATPCRRAVAASVSASSAARPSGQRLAANDREPAAERVVVGGGRVEELQPGRQVADDQAVSVDRAGHTCTPCAVNTARAIGYPVLVGLGRLVRELSTFSRDVGHNEFARFETALGGYRGQ